MSNSDILIKSIKKAKENGFRWPRWFSVSEKEFLYNLDMILDSKAYYSLIFSHEFAENLWLFDKNDWLCNLGEMSMNREPLKYIEKFL